MVGMAPHVEASWRLAQTLVAVAERSLSCLPIRAVWTITAYIVVIALARGWHPIEVRPVPSIDHCCAVDIRTGLMFGMTGPESMFQYACPEAVFYYMWLLEIWASPRRGTRRLNDQRLKPFL